MWTRSCYSLSASSLCWLVESVKSRYVSSVDLSTLLAHWINSPGAFYKRRQEKQQVKNQSGPATPKEDVRSDGAPESPSESDFLADFAGKHPPVGNHRNIAQWQLSAYDGEADPGVWRTELSLGRERHAHRYHYSECHDGRQNPTYDLPRRSHCGGYGLWKGKQTSSLPWAGGPYLLHADSEEEHEG